MNFNSKVTFVRGQAFADLINNNSDENLIIYSPTSAKKLNITFDNYKNTINSRNIGIDRSKIDEIINKTDVKKVISIGNGKTTDIAKYIAFVKNIELIVVPSSISTNVFSTNKVCLVENGVKTTLDGRTPDTILVDYDILSNSGLSYNLYGLCDVISIHTALKDWELATLAGKDKIDTLVFNMSKNLLEELFISVDEILKGTEESYQLLFKLVLLSGYVTNIYGSGRPESCSEHFFSKILENKIEIPHGISVSLGVLIMSILQNNETLKIFTLINKLGLLNNISDYNLSKQLLFSVLEEIRPRADRYSVLDEVDLNQTKISETILKLESILNIKFS